MDSSECGMRNVECGMKRLTVRCLLLTALLLLVAATACDNFDNGKLTEERAMHVFGTKGAPKEPPEEDTYSPPGGTWKDPTSGLTWQVMPTGGTMDWSDAKPHCAGLSLDGGGWHLPTIGELRTLIRGCPATEDGGSCNVEEGDCLAWSCRDDSCSGCSSYDGPGKDGMYWPDEIQGDCCWYWSSSPVEGIDDFAWGVYFNYGYVNTDVVGNPVHVRCVR